MTKVQLYHPARTDLVVHFPTEWNELYKSEIISIARTNFYSTLSESELFLHILQTRLEEIVKPKEATSILSLLSIEDLSMEYQQLSEFYRTSNKLTKLPFTLPNGYTPEPSFDSLTVGEFEEADQSLHSFLQDKDIAHANELARIVFRAEKYPLKFLESLIVSLWFIGCKNELLHIFPLLFNNDDTNNPDSTYDPMALTRLIHSGAGPKNGTRPQIRATLLKEFLYECQLQAEQPATDGSN